MKFFISIFLIMLVHLQVKVNAQTYNVVGCKANQQTLSLGMYKTSLVYCAGSDTLCGVAINSFGVWDKNVWKTFSRGMFNSFGERINSYTTYNNELITGGTFYFMDSILVNKIARWNGLEWNGLGTGLNAQLNSEKINCLEVYKGELYAAGKFNEINGIKGVNNIARWDGNTWRKVGTGLQGSLPEVYTMEVYNNELYVGGRFIDAGGVTAYNIAKWDGQTWTSVGLGTNSYVRILFKDSLRNLLFVGGGFNAVNNSILSNYLAKWNGTTWESIANNPFKLDVESIELYHGYIYVGGLSEKKQINFARWDGTKWDTLASLNGNVTNLQTYKNELYLGGNFTMIGVDSIPFLARYYSPDSIWLGVQNNKNQFEFSIFPNPTDKNICIRNNSPSFKKLKIIISNSQGSRIKELEYRDMEYFEFEMPEAKPGFYNISIISDQFRVFSQKIILVEK